MSLQETNQQYYQGAQPFLVTNAAGQSSFVTNFDTDLLIIPGIEISTNKGHIIGLGINDVLPTKLSVEETAEKIRDLSGEVVASHPFDFTRKGIGKNIQKIQDVIVETVNASCFLDWFNTKAKRYAFSNNLPETGGSDSHRLKDLGLAYTVCEAEITTIDDLLEAIRKKKTRGEGTHLTILEKIVRTFQIHF